ncbi:MAG: glycosyltransferase family 4 protein [Anaerolineae bacterium]|nr:glycosyltransferase family 4 protein [Anaerolineae bacterium]MDW8173538.1 glycosyltransferase family 4 protein [Anaerolineae bacterium]
MDDPPDKRLRILLVTHYFAPDGGAAAVRLTRLAQALVARGHRVTVLCPMPHYPQGRIRADYRGVWTRQEMLDGVRVVRAWHWATPSRSIALRLISQVSFMLMAALRGLALSRPDVLLIENQPVFTALAGWWLSKVKRRPYVVNVSDYWPEYLVAVGVTHEQSLIYRTFKALVNLTQRQASAIIALLPDILTSIQGRIGPHPNAHVIMNATDLSRFRPDVETANFRAQHGLGQAKLVTFAGTLGNHIDLDTMLKAAAHFVQRPDVLFLFLGTGIHRDALQGQALPNLRWVDWVDHADMPAAWAASHLTFWAVHDNATNRISLQSKVYEAMASGTPLVVAVEGVISQLLARSGAGETVPFGDAEALAQAIASYLDQPTKRDRASQAARAYAEQHFNFETVVTRYEAVLRSVAEA